MTKAKTRKGKTRGEAGKILDGIEEKADNSSSEEETEVFLVEVTKEVYKGLNEKAKKLRTTLRQYCREILEGMVLREPVSGGK